jgi:hypothetical protein
MGETIQHFGYTWMHVLDQTCGNVLIWSNLCKSAIVLCEAPHCGQIVHWVHCFYIFLYFLYALIDEVTPVARWGHPPAKHFVHDPWDGVIHCEDQSHISMAYPCGWNSSQLQILVRWGVCWSFRLMMIDVFSWLLLCRAWLAIMRLPLYGLYANHMQQHLLDYGVGPKTKENTLHLPIRKRTKKDKQVPIGLMWTFNVGCLAYIEYTSIVHVLSCFGHRLLMGTPFRVLSQRNWHRAAAVRMGPG